MTREYVIKESFGDTLQKIQKLDLRYKYSNKFETDARPTEGFLELIPPHSARAERKYGKPREEAPDFIKDLHTYSEEPLTAEQEHDLFYAMNLCLWRAAQLRKRLLKDPRSADTGELARQILDCFDVAQRTQEYIYGANMRLVAKVAGEVSALHRKYGSDAVYAEGQVILFRAIRGFDLARSTRFSTYAMNALQKSLGLSLFRARAGTKSERTTHLSQLPHGVEISGMQYEENPGLRLDEEERVEILQAELDQLIREAGLTDRELDMLYLKAGVDMVYEETLEEIGKHYDLSKERVRQIIKVALEKIRGVKRSGIYSEGGF